MRSLVFGTHLQRRILPETTHSCALLELHLSRRVFRYKKSLRNSVVCFRPGGINLQTGLWALGGDGPNTFHAGGAAG